MANKTDPVWLPPLVFSLLLGGAFALSVISNDGDVGATLAAERVKAVIAVIVIAAVMLVRYLWLVARKASGRYVPDSDKEWYGRGPGRPSEETIAASSVVAGDLEREITELRVARERRRADSVRGGRRPRPVGNTTAESNIRGEPGPGRSPARSEPPGNQS